MTSRGSGYYDEAGKHVCEWCGAHTHYQALSGGREFWCETCQTTGFYPEGEGGPRARLLAQGDAGVAELRRQMEEHLDARLGGGEA